MNWVINWFLVEEFKFLLGALDGAPPSALVPVDTNPRYGSTRYRVLTVNPLYGTYQLQLSISFNPSRHSRSNESNRKKESLKVIHFQMVNV